MNGNNGHAKPARRAISKRELPSWAPQKPEILVNIVDDIAMRRPSAPFTYYPILPASYAAGYRCITYGMFANIVNGLAHWIVSEFGPGRNHEALGYVGGNDVRYNAFIFACVKAGYQVSYRTMKCKASTDVRLPGLLHVPPQ